MAYTHPTILLIDDDEETSEALCELLAQEGYSVETAANGRQALQTLHRGLQPCIILMDLMMPEMNGFEFRKEQLANPDFEAIPLITYSGVSNLSTYAEQLRANAYIQKPAELAYVIAMVRQHCLK